MTRRLDLSRAGDCTCCGQPVALHFGSRNQKLSCDDVAERIAAQHAIVECTTFESASRVIAREAQA